MSCISCMLSKSHLTTRDEGSEYDGKKAEESAIKQMFTAYKLKQEQLFEPFVSCKILVYHSISRHTNVWGNSLSYI